MLSTSFTTLASICFLVSFELSMVWSALFSSCFRPTRSLVSDLSLSLKYPSVSSLPKRALFPDLLARTLKVAISSPVYWASKNPATARSIGASSRLKASNQCIPASTGRNQAY